MKVLITSIFYREWLKTRLVFTISMIVVVSVMLYIFLDFAHYVRSSELSAVIRNAIINNSQPFQVFKFVPTLLGLTYAICQFSPEMVDRRFRLTLHLPYKEHYIMAALLSYGTLSLLAFFFVAMLCSLLLLLFLPWALLCHIALAVYPWLICGFTTYALVVALIIEPYWVRKFCFLPILLTFAVVFLLDAEPYAFAKAGWFFIYAVIVAYVTPFYNMIRFKNGQAK